MLNTLLKYYTSSNFSTTLSTLCRKSFHQKSSLYSRRKTHYEILGLKNDASSAEIRSAFVNLAKEIHPDKNPNDPDNHSKFVLLNEAYMVLSKPLSRQEYDVNLAHWLHLQRCVARDGYSSHRAGGESASGFGSRTESYDGSQERIFWDETIWYMRDRTKDANAFYDEDSYYGVKGIRRQSNSTIVAICLVIMACGFLYFSGAFMYTRRKQQERLEKIDRKNLRLLKTIRERAKQNETIKQLEILDLKMSPNNIETAVQKSEK